MKLERLGLVYCAVLSGAFVVATAFAGCATSEPLDTAGPGGGPGQSMGGNGDGAAAGTTGSAGTSGAAGTTGAAGITGTAGTTGAAGITGTAGRGQAGTSGTGGRGGTTGTAGRGGTTGTAGRGGTGGGASPDGGTATFTQVYSQVVSVYCDGAACHNPGSQRGVSFSSRTSAYSYLRNQVMPGNPGSSYFYYIMTSDPRFMPPVGDPGPTEADLALVAAWINAGAPNN